MSEYTLPDDIQARSDETLKLAQTFVECIVKNNTDVFALQNEDQLNQLLGADHEIGKQFHLVRASIYFLITAMGDRLADMPLDAIMDAINNSLEACLDEKKVEIN